MTFLEQIGALTSRKSSSTPSLSDVSEKQSVASTEQASSAENLTSSVKIVSFNIQNFQKPCLKEKIYMYTFCIFNCYVAMSNVQMCPFCRSLCFGDI